MGDGEREAQSRHSRCLISHLAREGIDAPDLAMIRSGTHQVFASKQAGIVCRVLAPGEDEEAAVQRLLIAADLVTQGAKLLLPVVPEVLGEPDSRYTLWPKGETPQRVGSLEFAGVLKSIHDRDCDALPVWNPFDKIFSRLSSARAAGVPPGLLDALQCESERLIRD